ncbi:HARBI1 [Mytilus coruscus]|uniref:HARBI1 n=1 Tax=Mytilus coruscus TaxID=42192 RepID=A0A6J8ECT7_MYTCO|nr:HARBI1 [Mytilus coruscus]
MRELEHQQKEYTKENTPPIQKKPIPAKRTNAPRKKDKNELETVVKQLMSQIELLEKRQEQLINNSKHNRTDLTPQTADETIAYRPLNMNKRREKHQKICWRCGQPGHIAIGCKVRLDNSRKFDRAMIYQLVTNENQPTPTTYNKEERICGPANEVPISINGIDTKALLDTGSSVSTIRKFLNVVANWPGSCHDSFIFKTSNLGRYMEQTHRGYDMDGVLLGDSGYPCKRYIVTPYLRPNSESQVRYNKAHVKTRAIVERCFGWWKRRFNILHGEIRTKPEKAVKLSLLVQCFIILR